jgi:hypothetical protein
VANLFFSAYLSILLGFPQSLWRDRHLAHHANGRQRMRFSSEVFLESALILSLWAVIAAWSPMFFRSAYLPGYLFGICLCALHGYYEHARGTTSHYGFIYNCLFFNDGYHAEHHAHPETHWTRLPEFREHQASASAWPAPLRWMEIFSLESLERLVLRSPILQRFVLRTHARAFRSLVGALPSIQNVAIIGGGLFPRTALLLQQLLPAARITIIDANRANLDQARNFVGTADIEFVHAFYKESDRIAHDLLVIPLSFDGVRENIYARPPAPAVMIHDWIWRKRGASQIVSIALLKRINLVRR